VLGHRVDADAALAQAEKIFAANQPYNIATLHALRGELDQAILRRHPGYSGQFILRRNALVSVAVAAEVFHIRVNRNRRFQR